MARKKQLQVAKSPAEALLALSGSWEDPRKPEEIVSQIKKARKNSKKIAKEILNFNWAQIYKFTRIKNW
jgi:hypothetical protein